MDRAAFCVDAENLVDVAHHPGEGDLLSMRVARICRDVGRIILTASEGQMASSGRDDEADCSLADCTAPSEGQALHAVNAGQSIVQCIGDSGRGIMTDGMENDEVFLVAECIAPSEV